MKKTAPILAVALLAVLVVFTVAACGGDAGEAAGDVTTTAGGAVTTIADGAVTPADSSSSTDAAVSTDTTAAPTDTTAAASTDTTAAPKDGGASADKVFEPHELLSAEEASAITAFAVTLEDGSVFKSEETGTVSEGYKYDINSSTIHALVEIHEDGLRTSGGSAKDDFLGTKELVKGESTAVELGDDAFTAGQGQLHLLYAGYYIVVAFDADEYGTDKNAPLNVKLGTKILENLKAKLG